MTLRNIQLNALVIAALLWTCKCNNGAGLQTNSSLVKNTLLLVLALAGVLMVCAAILLSRSQRNQPSTSQEIGTVRSRMPEHQGQESYDISAETVESNESRETVESNEPRETVESNEPRETVESNEPRETVESNEPRETVEREEVIEAVTPEEVWMSKLYSLYKSEVGPRLNYWVSIKECALEVADAILQLPEGDCPNVGDEHHSHFDCCLGALVVMIPLKPGPQERGGFKIETSELTTSNFMNLILQVNSAIGNFPVSQTTGSLFMALRDEVSPEPVAQPFVHSYYPHILNTGFNLFRECLEDTGKWEFEDSRIFWRGREGIDPSSFVTIVETEGTSN